MSCKWEECSRPSSKELGYRSRSYECPACSRAASRNRRCEDCGRPLFGMPRPFFCRMCGPFRPPRELKEGEVSIVLIAPDSREREVFRSEGDWIPGSGSKVSKSLATRPFAERHIVAEVSAKAWVGARLL